MASDVTSEAPTAAPMVSRAALLDAADAFVEYEVRPDPATGLQAGWLPIVARPRVRLVSTVVADGELRRAEAWISPLGIVAIAHQEDEHTPTAVVALPPQEAYSLVVSTASLTLSAIRATESLDAPQGMVGLVGQILGGADEAVRLCVLDWDVDDTRSRWVMLDSDGGRVGTLDAPADTSEVMRLEPMAPMELLSAFTERVALAVASEADG